MAPAQRLQPVHCFCYPLAIVAQYSVFWQCITLQRCVAVQTLCSNLDDSRLMVPLSDRALRHLVMGSTVSGGALLKASVSGDYTSRFPPRSTRQRATVFSPSYSSTAAAATSTCHHPE
jgi:hypothetical protein